MTNSTTFEIFLNEALMKAFVEAIGGFAWNHDFYEFCNVLQFNPEHSYALEKWQQFQLLNKALSQFDVQSLYKLVAARSQQVKQ